MYPILFDKNSTSFTSNGIGRLSDVQSCTVEETLNGVYELEMKYGVNGKHFNDIEVLSTIQAKANAMSGLQAFDVYQITAPLNRIVTVKAQHVRYRLNKNVTMPFSVLESSTACADTLQGLKNNAVEDCPFTFSTAVTTAASYSQPLPSTIGERLAGVEGSVLDQFGGQYTFDNFNVTLSPKRGRINTGVNLKYGKNLTSFSQETNIANTIVGIVPYWHDTENNEVVSLPEKAVYSSHASSFPRMLIAPHDFSSLFEEAPTVESLRSAAQAYVNQSTFGVPVVSIKLSFVQLWDTEEYKDYAPLEELTLGDEVNVIFEDLGVSATAQIVKYKYDCINEKYISMEIGNLRSNLATTITDQEAKTLETIELGNKKIIVEANATAIDAVNNATAWLTSFNGYVVAVKNLDGSWKELLFMDTNDPDTATNVLRINGNGLGFSTTGIDGPYTNAWTIDGNLVADFITTGILKDINNTFVLDLDNGTLTLSPDAAVGDDTLSGMKIKISANERGLTTEVERATEEEGILAAAISQNEEEISLKVSKGNVSSELSVESDAITLSTAGRLLITAGNFLLDSSGTMTCTNANIKGTITVGGNNNANGEIYIKDSSGNNILTLDKSGLTATNFSINSNGTMTCTNANIKGTITLGGNNNTNGVLYLNNSSGNTLFQLDNNGLTSYRTSYGYYNATYAYTGLINEKQDPNLGIWRRYANAISYYASGDLPSSPVGLIGIDESGNLRIRTEDTLSLSGYNGVDIAAYGNIDITTDGTLTLTSDSSASLTADSVTIEATDNYSDLILKASGQHSTVSIQGNAYDSSVSIDAYNDLELTCNNLYINNNSASSGSAMGFTFEKGICTSISGSSGMTINLGYVDEYGAHYQMQFTDGILTDRVPI